MPRCTTVIALMVLIPAARLAALDVPDLNAPLPTRPEIRVLEADAGVLLSKDGHILAAACLRPTDRDRKHDDAEVLSAADATAALAGEKLQSEKVRERRFPMIGGPPNSTLNVLVQTRTVLNGFRALIACSASKPKNDPAAALGDKLPLVPPPLEIAIQIYPDADGKPLKLTYLDGDLVPEKKADATELRARSLTFENAKKQRVTLERSGPATWTIRRSQNAIFLVAKLAKDPHDPAMWGSFLFFLGSGHDEDPPEVSLLRLDKTMVPARDLIEGSLRVYASGANPYLSQDVTVVAEVAMPPRADGTVPTRNLPCFFYESANPSAEEGEFRFRFAPPIEGLYGVRVYVTTPASKCNTDPESFRAGVPASSGIARVRAGERVLRLDDGTLFAPVGYDLARFGAKDGLDAFREKFIELERIGANTACIALSRLMPLEGPDAGHIDVAVAEQLDAIFKAAQVRGIRLIFALETGGDIGKGSATHPYFIEMGGPLPASAEFFHDQQAKRLFQARMLYAAARYSAFRSLLSWEIVRNIDDAWPLTLKKDPGDKSLPPAEIDRSRRGRRDVEEWLAQMAQQLRGFDQHGHPICVSTALEPGKGWPGLQAVENIDWTLYRDAAAGARSVNEKFPGIETKIGQWAGAGRGPTRARRPWAIGGFGAALDNGGALFASLAHGLACAPMIVCDPGKPVGDAERGWLRGASIFNAALAEISTYDAKDELATVSEYAGAPGPNTPLAVARACRRGAAVWIQNNTVTTAGGEFKLPGLTEGNYTISWMDTRSGEMFENRKYVAPPQQAGKGLEPFVLKLPALKGDAAVFIVRDR